LFVGAANVFNVNTTTTDANIKSNISGGNLIIQANVSGTTFNVATALGASGTFAIGNAATVGTTMTVTGNSSGGNLTTSGQVSAIGNITGGNLNTSALVAAATVSATANVQAGNLRTAGIISSTGNITSAGNIDGTYFLGNGSQLTGLSLGS
jgi:filamentous hemagglutinin